MALAQYAILDAYLDGSGNTQVRAAFWLVAPATRVVPNPSFASQVSSANGAWQSSTSVGALMAQFVAGTLVESVPPNLVITGAASQSQITAALRAKFSTLQSALTSNVFGAARLVGGWDDGTTFHTGP
jgi:hypothetical protein